MYRSWFVETVYPKVPIWNHLGLPPSLGMTGLERGIELAGVWDCSTADRSSLGREPRGECEDLRAGEDVSDFVRDCGGVP